MDVTVLREKEIPDNKGANHEQGRTMIWKNSADPKHLNAMSKDTMLEHLGITFTDSGDNYIEATMPVDERTVQPFGLLHGGASVTLAESLGSVAANLCIDDTTRYTSVGVEINANHLRPVRSGQDVTGRTTPVRVGRRIQVWNVDIRDEKHRLICTSRITVAVIDRPR